ncbi:glutamate receptor U1-like [Periplaneta americana]|uniref:glutamate receptor U1-like n=1 Tax=Periplaneta americana TaxID=6978 RepID=UPI0037E7BFF5
MKFNPCDSKMEAWLALFICIVKVHSFTVPEAASVVVSVRNHFASGCMFVVYSSESDLREIQKTVHFKKQIAEHHVTMATISEHSLADWSMDTFNCQRNLPLVVFLYAGREIRHTLRQLSVEGRLSRARWLLFLDNGAQDFFTDIDVPFHCSFLVAQKEGNSTEVAEVYRIAPSLPLRTHYLQNIASVSAENSYRRRNNLHGLVMRAATLATPGFTNLNIGGDTSLKVLASIGEIWFTLEKQLKFTTVFTSPADGIWGLTTDNGSWPGVVGMVQRGEIDVCTLPIFFSQEMMDAVDFLAPLNQNSMINRMRVYIRKPKPGDLTWCTLLSPLSGRLWGAVGATIALLAVGLAAFGHVAHLQGSESARLSVPESVQCVLASFCQQSNECRPRSPSCRLIFMTSYLLSTILLTAYSATLISFLAVRQANLPFTTFQGLLEDGSYRIGALTHSILVESFNNSIDPVMQTLYHKLSLPKKADPKGYEEGFFRVCHEKLALLCPNLIAERLKPKMVCDVVPIPQANFAGTVSLISRKRNPYIGILSSKLRDMLRSGVYQRIDQQYLVAFQQFHGEETVSGIELGAVGPVLTVTMGNILVAILILIAERCVSHRSVTK